MRVKSNDRNKTLKIKLSGFVGVLEKLVDFLDVELFGNVHTYLEILVFTEDSEGIAEAIKLLDLELVTDVK